MFQDMTDLSRYNPPLDGVDLYSGACKCFQQARIHYESIPNPDEEVCLCLFVCMHVCVFVCI